MDLKYIILSERNWRHKRIYTVWLVEVKTEITGWGSY